MSDRCGPRESAREHEQAGADYQPAERSAATAISSLPGHTLIQLASRSPGRRRQTHTWFGCAPERWHARKAPNEHPFARSSGTRRPSKSPHTTEIDGVTGFLRCVQGARRSMSQTPASTKGEAFGVTGSGFSGLLLRISSRPKRQPAPGFCGGDNAEADERGHGELRVLESTGSKQAIGASQVGVC